MAVDATRQSSEPPAPGLVRRLVDFYEGVMVEMRKVTWPDRAQVQQSTIAIIVFVLLIALLITSLDAILNLLLVQVLPSLFGGH